jgi:hypothetical protein
MTWVNRVSIILKRSAISIDKHTITDKRLFKFFVHLNFNSTQPYYLINVSKIVVIRW